MEHVIFSRILYVINEMQFEKIYVYVVVTKDIVDASCEL